MFIKKAIYYALKDIENSFLSKGIYTDAVFNVLKLAQKTLLNLYEGATYKENFNKTASSGEYDKMVDAIKKSLKNAKETDKINIFKQLFDDPDDYIAKMLTSKYLYDSDKFKKEMPEAYSFYSGEYIANDQNVPEDKQEHLTKNESADLNLEDSNIEDLEDKDEVEKENGHSEYKQISDIDFNENKDKSDKLYGKSLKNVLNKIEIKEDVDKGSKDVDSGNVLSSGVTEVEPDINAFNTSINKYSKYLDSRIRDNDVFSIWKDYSVYFNNPTNMEDKSINSILEDKDTNNDNKVL